MKRRSTKWEINKRTGLYAKRYGFYFLPDFASTAYMAQGLTLIAAFADLQHHSSDTSLKDQIAAYICLSRVKVLEGMCIMQPFSPYLFSHGNPPGPARLLKNCGVHCHLQKPRKSGIMRILRSGKLSNGRRKLLRRRKNRKRCRRQPALWLRSICVLLAISKALRLTDATPQNLALFR